MNIIVETLRDRGSRYAVSGGPVADRAGALDLLAVLKTDRKFARATHSSWAVVLTNDGAIKNDDGEAGAGAVILKMLEREGLRDHVVIVTRWYGGVNLGGDRFAHVVTSVRAYLAALRDGKW
jgi:putative IMPACT (imprinted ancient) family translation regulator